ncbi:winged helix DNA-binding protein [Curtobacterium pusillum]|uniref:MarR family transcriptional regulator n=1 Tax=Curtobacterium pusillum TaxID=69373 RepID=A0AAW3T0X3_9MICO|nr:MarR family transcriptional regulator [Curtobacterium pusillum]MBA8988835.1 DNA-binding MarR family transcriptional regulator [Curtobacterium pusillum]NUU13587.1 MarR family transcriptional regulator [Curtobacterium pusillum]GLK32174.1 MarR family transcriptional regulator [Curtobacterium pusillum]
MNDPLQLGTDTDTSALRASIDLRVAVGRLRRRMREVSSGDELTASQVSVLARLAKGEAASASALAVLEGVKPQSMAVTLAGLEELGLIRRSADPSDGRRQIVTLTDAGEHRNSGLREVRSEWLVRTMDESLTEAERRTVIDAAAIIERMVRR